MLLTKRLLLHWAIPNVVPFNLALEASDLGRILDLNLALLLLFLLNLGLGLVVGVESKSTLVIGGLLHTQHVGKCTFPFMTLSKTFFKEATWALRSFISSTWLVATKALEEVEVSLLEQQGKASNSSQEVPTL